MGVVEKNERNKILVLIAEDEVNLLLLLKDSLEEYGFEVLTAVNGEEALQKSTLERPNLIILDVEMPKLNGWQVCERIKQNPDLKAVPILILSAYAQPIDIKKGFSLGIQQYFTKPFKMKELVESIRQISGHLNS